MSSQCIPNNISMLDQLVAYQAQLQQNMFIIPLSSLNLSSGTLQSVEIHQFSLILWESNRDKV